MIRRVSREGPVYAGLGDALYLKGDMDGAADAYRKAVRHDPGRSRPWLGLGAVQETEGESGKRPEGLPEGMGAQPDLSSGGPKGPGDSHSPAGKKAGIADPPKRDLDPGQVPDAYWRNNGMNPVDVSGIRFGGGSPFVLIAGPCVIEEDGRTKDIARFLRDLAGELGVRSSSRPPMTRRTERRASFRGPGLSEGLRILEGSPEDRRDAPSCPRPPVRGDRPAAGVLDVVADPGLPLRQKDFVMEIAGRRGWVNIKKGQFLARGTWPISWRR
jgi:hypothetical protein